MRRTIINAALCLLLPSISWAEVGDPQIKTDHPWYPGELAISSFDRLAKTQADVYRRETGRSVDSDEDKALASWYWRNLHYAHCQEGTGDYFDQGFNKGQANREYWHGLFAHGMSLCGTTHAQWSAEMDALLGHCRGRCAGVVGHVSFEVFLKGGAYGEGKWALLDHDVSTVIFDPDQQRLLSIDEIRTGDLNLRDNNYLAARQQGWRIAGLYEGDVKGLYDVQSSGMYLAGYAGPPPTVHLRRGESLRRYTQPGLADGKTFVFWGLNRNRGGVAGPQRDRTWVNQPEKMYRAARDAGSKTGRFRYGNAVYTYRPRFSDGTYRESVVSEDSGQVTFEFNTPYIIAATPPNDDAWGIYDAGCRNGLIVRAPVKRVSVSTDCGQTWHSEPTENGSVDLTDHVKGHQQYLLRIAADPKTLRDGDVATTTVCQLNSAIVPRLKSGDNQITYAASGRAIFSAGPNRDQASAHVVDGDMDQRGGVTLELATPRGEQVTAVYAASHNRSGNPPPDGVSYSIDYSLDQGGNWQPVVADWQIERRKPEPDDMWSQSFAYGTAALNSKATQVQVRFQNTGGKTYRRVEAHLGYQVANPTEAVVTFAWSEDGGPEQRSAQPVKAASQQQSWSIAASGDVETRWVEISAP